MRKRPWPKGRVQALGDDSPMKRPRFSVSRETTLRAQRLRREATPLEKLLWSKLRHAQVGGYRFRRQHPVGPYILDFYCTDLKLCIEVDGDTHGAQASQVHDARRTDYLAARGITVVRFWNNEIRECLDAVAERVLAQCRGLERRR
jgi:very-short-patch-repair endonuclease